MGLVELCSCRLCAEGQCFPALDPQPTCVDLPGQGWGQSRETLAGPTLPPRWPSVFTLSPIWLMAWWILGRTVRPSRRAARVGAHFWGRWGAAVGLGGDWHRLSRGCQASELASRLCAGGQAAG